MMACNYEKITQNCATCKFWGGRREIDMSGLRVTVDSESSEGKCLNQSGPKNRQELPANGSCYEWTAWEALQ